MPIELLITNIVGGICAALTLIMGSVVLWKGRDKMVSVPFFLLTVTVTGFYVSHLLGINAHTAAFANKAFMWNLINIGLICFNAHFLLALIGKVEKRWAVLTSMYGLGVILILFFVFFPEQFLATPVPKLYLPFYYEPGPLHTVMRVFFFAVAIYMFTELAFFYRKADEVMRKRLKYVFVSHIYAYIVGSSAVLLIYDIPADPMWAMFFGLYLPPLVYGILKYDVIDLRVLAKRAFLYAVGVAVVSLIMGVITTLNTTLVALVPHFSPWIIPILSGFIAIGIASVVWNRMREIDVLKYDFISIVTHKFWTPVTHMKMAVDELRVADNPEMRDACIKEIDSSASRLFELTKVLIGLSDAENEGYRLISSPMDISALVAGLISDHRHAFSEKKVRVIFNPGANLPEIITDRDHIGLALRVIFENAITYTPQGGTIEVSLKVRPEPPSKPLRVACIIKDSGIGISQEETRLIFDKFFRGHRARLMYTEGLGVSLFIAKRIIERAGGVLTVHSEGLDKGTTFSIEFPIVSREKEEVGGDRVQILEGGSIVDDTVAIPKKVHYEVPAGFVGKRGVLSHTFFSKFHLRKHDKEVMRQAEIARRLDEQKSSIFSDNFMQEAIERAKKK